jgi:IPT/TIG domain/Putative Ig domain
MNRSIWLAITLTVLAAGCGIQGPLQIGTSSLPDAAVQQNYAAQLTAIGVSAPFTWSLASGTLPPGVSLSDSTGVLSGSPLTAGEFNFSVRVTIDTTPPISALSRPLKIVVKKAGATTKLTVVTTSLASGSDKASYAETLIATGGITPYTWNLASGALPPGVALSSSAGTLTGSPTSSGSFSFSVGVRDSSHPSGYATQALSISIGSTVSPLGIITTSLPSGTVQSTYGTALIASGGTAPYSWSLASGSLPPGLALSSSTGALSGTPTAAGTFSFTVGVADSSSQHATRVLSVSVAATAPSLRITTSSLPSGAVQVAYSAALAATGGSTPYNWSVSALPAGLALNSGTGAITGTPTQAGSFSFSAQVKDSTGATASASLNASIAPPSSPVVSAISPQSGATSGGTTVTISGSNFASGATVLFGGTAAGSVKVMSSSQMQAVTPAHIAGTVGVSLSQNGQTATLSNSFTYNAITPTVTSISPDSGTTAGGTTVTISGSNFLAGALVLFGTVSAPSVNISSGSQIQVVTPAHASGLVDVAVVNPGNLTATLASAFTYNSPSSGPPTITAVSPTSGAPGTQITITGTNFVSADQVSFGSTNATSNFVSATQLAAVVPSISAGTYSLTVTDPDPASVTMDSAFTVTTPPPSTSVLSGCTVSSSNTVNWGQNGCPSQSTVTGQGWTAAYADNASSGGPNGGVIYAGTATCAAPGSGHGSTSYCTTYTGDGNQIAVSSPAVTGSQFYMSFWDYVDSDALYSNSDYQNGGFIPYWGSSTCGSAVTIGANSQNSLSLASYLTGTFIPGGSGTSGSGTNNCAGSPNYNQSFTLPINAGTWRQYEILYVPNTMVTLPEQNPQPTCAGSSQAGCGNGTLKIWVNGQLKLDWEYANLNSTQTIDSVKAWFGGFITSFAAGADTTRCTVFSSTGGGTCAGTQPGTGAPKPFSRYIDDLIVLKK